MHTKPLPRDVNYDDLENDNSRDILSQPHFKLSDFSIYYVRQCFIIIL